jgi:YidC/Oxa1 family membrane protein insertase
VQPVLHFFSIVFYEPIFNALMLLYHGVHDYGLAIIILTLIVRFALVPLTIKQLRSSKVMQELQPKMKELQRRYANDKERLMKEQMALYREHSYNPVAGCLPLLIQLPFLYGLFYALRNVFNKGVTVAQINQQIYPFLPKLHALPSTYLSWFAFLPGHPALNLALPDPTHVLPIVAALATFAQLRMAQPRMAAQQPSKDTQTAMMSQMSYIMPIITGFFAWTFPAGLALYWTVSTLFTMVQQYFITGWGSLPTTISGLRFGAVASPGAGAGNSSGPQAPSAVQRTNGANPLPEKGRKAGDTKAVDGAGPSAKVPVAKPPPAPGAQAARPSAGGSIPPSFSTTRRERNNVSRQVPRSKNGTAQRNRPVSKPKGGKS